MVETSPEFESKLFCSAPRPLHQQIVLTHKTEVVSTDLSSVCQKEATTHFMKALLQLPKKLDSSWKMEKEMIPIR